jgi:hypothetical protein
MQLDDFIQLGQEQLSGYLDRIIEYLCVLEQEDLSKRDDLELVQSSPERYLRHLLCVAVLNRLYREEFLKTDHRLIVLPECLKNYGPDICCKIERKNHSECAHCLADCQVNLVSETFVNNKTDLILEPEDVDKMATDWRAKHGTVGIVGVACILTLASGFKSTLKQKHPTQGVFLNYSSCGHHWNKLKPYNTRFSLTQLARVMQADAPAQSLNPPIKGETYSFETAPGAARQLYELLNELAERFMTYLYPAYEQPGQDIYDTGQVIMNEILNEPDNG